MKIIEKQSAILSNYEVYVHLMEQRARYNKPAKKRRGPPNLETVVREVLSHLETPPGPLSQQPITYAPDSFSRLLERLRPYELSKQEVLMIVNMRPASVAGLNTVLEDMATRFSYEDQVAMVTIITEVLGGGQTDRTAGEERNREAGQDGKMDTSG